MTEREALKLALEALEKYAHDFGSSDLSVKAMYVARNALAQPDQLFEENERLHVENRRLIDRIETIGVPVGVGGFATTTTAQRTWVGLTPQERDEINEQVYGAVPHHVAFHHAIEAKLKEKNS